MIRGGENMMKNYVIVSGEYLNDMKNHVNQILRVCTHIYSIKNTIVFLLE